MGADWAIWEIKLYFLTNLTLCGNLFFHMLDIFVLWLYLESYHIHLVDILYSSSVQSLGLSICRTSDILIQCRVLIYWFTGLLPTLIWVVGSNNTISQKTGFQYYHLKIQWTWRNNIWVCHNTSSKATRENIDSIARI